MQQGEEQLTTIEGTDRAGFFVEYSVDAHGARQGLYREWWGQERPKVAATYKDGALHDLYQEWHENGGLACSCFYVEGALEGVLRRWWPDGRLAEETPYLRGKKHGLSQVYSEGSGGLVGAQEWVMGIRFNVCHDF